MLIALTEPSLQAGPYKFLQKHNVSGLSRKEHVTLAQLTKNSTSVLEILAWSQVQ